MQLRLLALAVLLSPGAGAFAQNPYLPLWEHLPDGEPRVFEDPDNPGRQRAYIIGSHDLRFTSYCGPDIRMWSAPVEDLTAWRDEGPLFTYKFGDRWDVMFAPDLVEVRLPGGKKEYYLYPHSRGWGREALVCKSDRPDGPFTILNLSEDGSHALEGSIMGFDPSVYVEQITDPSDPDFKIGFRAYGYWGFQRSSAAQLDQVTMYSVREGTEVVPYFIPASFTYGKPRPIPDAKYAIYEGQKLEDFNFFEASSIRKVGSKYVWVFSGHSGPDYGLPSSNSTLRYAYSDSPMGPWKSGGVLVDSRAPVLSEDGHSIVEGYCAHNTHGSLQKIGDQWYVFYHRPPRGYGFARQAMVSPVTVVDDGKKVADGGKIEIFGYDPYVKNNILTVSTDEGVTYKGAEVTSEGFNVFGLPPYKYYSAGYACFMTNKPSQQDTWDVWGADMEISPVVSGDVIGYKYFSFGGLKSSTKGLPPFKGTGLFRRTALELFLTPLSGEEFSVEVWMDSPYKNNVHKGKLLGTVTVPEGSAPGEVRKCTLPLGLKVDLKGRKHAIYLRAVGAEGKELFSLQGLGFSCKEHPLDRPVVPEVEISMFGRPLPIPALPTRSTDWNGYLSQDIYEMPVDCEVKSLQDSVVASCSDKDVQIEKKTTENGLDILCTYRGKTKTFRLFSSTGVAHK